MPDLSPLRQAVSALRPVFKTQGHDPHPNWGDEGHDPDPQLGVWFMSRDGSGNSGTECRFALHAGLRCVALLQGQTMLLPGKGHVC